MSDPAGRVTLIVVCAYCQDEHQLVPPVLGRVRRHTDGSRVWEQWVPTGWLIRPRQQFETLAAWEAAGRPHVGGSRGVRLLATPLMSRLKVPPEVDVVCKRHGPGTLATRTVLTARGRLAAHYEARG